MSPPESTWMTALSACSAACTARVLLGDGRALFRTALVRLLRSQPLLLVVAEAEDAAAVLRAASVTAPDVAVIEWDLPGGALDAVQRLRARHPQTEVLLYGLPRERGVLAAGIEAGVKGFVDDEADLDDLVRSIHRVAAGEWQISPRLVHQATTARTAPPAPELPTPPRHVTALTPRELEILQLIAAGRSNRAAAALLGLSEHTVRAHLRSISHKLGVRNRVEAVAVALEAGLIAVEPEVRGHLAEPEDAILPEVAGGHGDEVIATRLDP